MSVDIKTQYEAVVADLEMEKADVQTELGGLQKRLRDLDNAIITLRRKIDPEWAPLKRLPPASVIELRSPAPSFPPELRYGGIGVRWAILHLLGERGAMTTSDIADALKNAGIRTKAVNFANNVSAMLSTTMRTKAHEEVESVGGKWSLTENGRNKLAKVVASRDFLRACPWAEAPDVTASSASAR